MTQLPENTHTTAHKIYEFYEKKNASEKQRGYLGWSQIGKPCSRALWYGFRLASKKAFPGRISRLFETGHLEETRVIRNLREIGCTVWDFDPLTGKQFAVSSVGGHFKGHADCIVKGLPEEPKTTTLVDVKTIKSKKFDELLKKGMEALYPEYWAQAHGYIGLLTGDITRAMFIFICKDDDRIHCERFAYDKAVFDKYIEKATSIITAAEPPEKLSQDPSWYECKFCDYASMCHGTDVPANGCRSCAHATPELTGNARWSCAKHGADIPTVEDQIQGCSSHRYIPILLTNFAKPVDAVGDDVVYQLENGQTFVNGDAGFTSKEIHACADKNGLGMVANNKFCQDMREQFGAEVVA